MKNVYFILSFVLFLQTACNVGKREKAEQIIKNFEAENVPDEREMVFSVHAQYNHGKLVLKGETSEQELKTHLLALFESLDFADSVAVLPDASAGEKTFAIVTVPVANLRGAPSYSSELVTQAILGTPVKILKKEGGWFFIQTPDKYISWVDQSAIWPVTYSELNEWKKSTRIIFTGLNGTIYEDEDLSVPISDVTLGCILTQTAETVRLMEIRFPDGRTGFVAPQKWLDFHTFKTETEAVPENIIALAKQLSGRSYLWGGTSVNAMDCSGFVKTVFFANGLILARDASLQARHGREIQINNTQLGDLLFFGRKATETETERITHVALSTGDSEFIHASGHIRQNSFNPDSPIYSEYRKNSFVKAMRIIGFEGDGIQHIKNHSWY
jgi:hypothetical protein